MKLYGYMAIKWNKNNMERSFWEVFAHLFVLMFWPILTKWCTKGSYRTGRTHPENSCHSSGPYQNENVMYWIESSIGSILYLVLFHVSITDPKEVLESVPLLESSAKLQFGVFQRFLFAEVPWESTVGHHGSRKQCQRGKSSVSRKKNPEADWFFKFVARGESYHTFLY